MNESNSIEKIDEANLTNQTKFRLDEIILSKRLIKENHVVKN